VYFAVRAGGWESRNGHIARLNMFNKTLCLCCGPDSCILQIQSNAKSESKHQNQDMAESQQAVTGMREHRNVIQKENGKETHGTIRPTTKESEHNNLFLYVKS
jgi:hypothetical protein